MKKELKIKWDSGNASKEYDLLNPDYLSRVGINDKIEIAVL